MSKLNKPKQYVKVTKTAAKVVKKEPLDQDPEEEEPVVLPKQVIRPVVKRVAKAPAKKLMAKKPIKKPDTDSDENDESDDVDDVSDADFEDSDSDQDAAPAPMIAKQINKKAPKDEQVIPKIPTIIAPTIIAPKVVREPVLAKQKPAAKVAKDVVVMNLKKEVKTIKGYEKQVIEDVRKARGKQQKIFLILTHEYDESELERKYEVMGTTGNVYTVGIVNSPTCTCPDYTTRNKRCKHIYFVLTRIMKVKSDQEDIEEYSDEDLQDMFENIPQITENLRVDASKLAKFKSLKKNGNGEVEKREIDEEAMCPICLAELYDCDEELIHCRYSCGYSLHKQCFDMYNSKQHGECKCIFCQKPWENELKKQYLNIE